MPFRPTTYAAIQQLIHDRSARIGVVGPGNVGLPLALLFSAAGFWVKGFDLDAKGVDRADDVDSYMWPISPQEIASARKRGFCATSNFDGIADTDAVILCISTSLNGNYEPDLNELRKTALLVAPHLRAGQLVILESTTYPGATEEEVLPILERNNLAALRVSRDSARPHEFFLAFSAEKNIGENRWADERDVATIVGGIDRFSTALAFELYSSVFKTVVPLSSTAAAEMAHLFDNVYRSVNIALTNEIKHICQKMDVDISEVIEAAKTKAPGAQALYPGPGLDSRCIALHSFYLSWKARKYGFRARLVELAGEANANMPYFVLQSTVEALRKRRKTLRGSRILILQFPPEKRHCASPSMPLVELLREAGAEVDLNLPSPQVAAGCARDSNMNLVPLQDVSTYDAVLIASNHDACNPEEKSIDTYDYECLVKQAQLVVDTQNATAGIVSEKVVRC